MFIPHIIFIKFMVLIEDGDRKKSVIIQAVSYFGLNMDIVSPFLSRWHIILKITADDSILFLYSIVSVSKRGGKELTLVSLILTLCFTTRLVWQ